MEVYFRFLDDLAPASVSSGCSSTPGLHRAIETPYIRIAKETVRPTVAAIKSAIICPDDASQAVTARKKAD
jgi:hypothetical protein